MRKKKPQARPFKLLLVGDVMLGRLVNEILKVEPPASPWGDTLPLFQLADVRLCNLECVLSDGGTPWSATPKVFHFRSDAKNVAVLQAAHGAAEIAVARCDRLRLIEPIISIFRIDAIPPFASTEQKQNEDDRGYYHTESGPPGSRRRFARWQHAFVHRRAHNRNERERKENPKRQERAAKPPWNLEPRSPSHRSSSGFSDSSSSTAGAFCRLPRRRCARSRQWLRRLRRPPRP